MARARATSESDSTAATPRVSGATPRAASDPESPLGRRDREGERAHRAFLLYAMQDPERRSSSAAGRGVSRAESTTREWRRRWSWEDRISALGEAADVKAATAYREWYYPRFRLREIVEVEDRLAAPFRPESVVSPTVAAEVREAARGDTQREAAADARKRSRRRHMALIDGALGLVAKRVAAGEVRVTLRDIPTLLDLRERLEDPHAGTGGGGVVIESVRVRVARDSGGDVIEAMHEDALELVAILGAIRSAGNVPAEILNPALASSPESA